MIVQVPPYCKVYSLGPAGEGDVEGDMKGVWMETPARPLDQGDV